MAAAFAAKAAQAEAVETTMSTPYVLSGEAAGRRIRGAGSVTFAEAGKAMTRERGTVALRDVEALHARFASEAFDAAGAGLAHAPAS